ncbi:unnamed protein product [Heterobilharzia americana]|nr:unnamed protein product [Heterobilharzia americana]
MRLRSSLRKTNKPIECPKENVHVKPKPTAKADNSRHKNDDILQSRTAFSKSCPPGKRNLNINAFLEDPYLFVDDSDDDKENIDPNDFKTVTRKYGRKLKPSAKTRSRQLSSSAPFTAQYIPSKESTCLVKHEADQSVPTSEPVMKGVSLVLKTPSDTRGLQVSSTSNPNQRDNLKTATGSSSVCGKISTFVEDRKVCLSAVQEHTSNLPHQATNVPFTPEYQKHVSTHVSDGSIPVISKGALCNLNPQNSSTPSTSNPTTGLQISVGPHGVIPTPINYPLNKRSNEIRDNSIECIADHPLQIDPICTSNTVASDVDKDDTSSKDASKESTSSSGRRRKKESESERQKAYESWLDEFNAELQKYESFELSVENVSQTTDH